ncbi:MAG: hypothetical protein AAGH76_06825 [Pseudomonadota bacterium]
MTSPAIRRSVLWTVFAIGCLLFALSDVADRAAERYGSAAFQRTLVTFAVARALNGVISVAQGTEVAVEPGGVGVNFGVGQILDPVNDLVERFSGIMLLASSSAGLQNFLLPMVRSYYANIALAGAMLLFVITVWLPSPRFATAQLWARKAFLLFVFVRFAVPLLIVGSSVLFDTFLAKEQAAAVAALQATSDEIAAMNDDSAPVEEPEDTSLLGRIGAAFDETLATVNVADRMQRFRDALSNASEHIINLIVIFVLQTVVFPLVFVWLLAQGLKMLAGRMVSPE